MTCKLDQVCDQLRIKLHGIDHRPQRRQPRITASGLAVDVEDRL